MRPEFTFNDLLHNSVERDPGKVAIVDGKSEYTYEDLSRQSSALAAALQDAGVEKGDRVGILMDKYWEAIVAMLAATRTGAAFVNVNPMLKPPQVRYIAEDCDIRVMIGDSSKLDDMEPKTVERAFYRGERPDSAGVSGELVDLAEVLQGEDTPKDVSVSEIDLATILYTSG